MTHPHHVFYINNATSKSIILSCIFLYESLKNYIIQSFKECLFSAFCLFRFLLLSNNTLLFMFYTYICHWNMFQNKYIRQITFHVVKHSPAQVTSKDICLLFIILFLRLFLFCLDFVLFCEALLLPWLFNWPRV